MSNLNILRYLCRRSRQTQASSQQTNEELENPTTHRHHRKVYKRGFLENIAITNVNCRDIFRLSIQEIYQITSLLDIEKPLRFKGITVSRQLGFAMLAFRCSYSRQYEDMEIVFKMDCQNIKKVCRGMEDLLFSKMKYEIQFNTHQFREENLKRFATAIDEAGALFPSVIGFIDGTLQQVSHPSTDIDIQKPV